MIRSPLPRGTTEMRRTRLNPRSARTIAAAPDHLEVRRAVFARDGHQCLLRAVPSAEGCWGVLTPHHLRKSVQGGAYEPLNLVSLCEFHNSWVELFPNAAHVLGLVCRNGETLRECWDRLVANGLVRDYPVELAG